MRCGRKQEPESAKKLVTSVETSPIKEQQDVMKAKVEIFGFLAVEFFLAQTNAQIIVTKGDGIVWSLQ